MTKIAFPLFLEQKSFTRISSKNFFCYSYKRKLTINNPLKTTSRYFIQFIPHPSIFAKVPIKNSLLNITKQNPKVYQLKTANENPSNNARRGKTKARKQFKLRTFIFLRTRSYGCTSRLVVALAASTGMCPIVIRWVFNSTPRIYWCEVAC